MHNNSFFKIGLPDLDNFGTKIENNILQVKKSVWAIIYFLIFKKYKKVLKNANKNTEKQITGDPVGLACYVYNLRIFYAALDAAYTHFIKKLGTLL